LKKGWTFDRPPANRSIHLLLIQEDEAVRIDLVKLDDGSFHSDGLRLVEVRDRMMGPKRSSRNERKENDEASCHRLLHLGHRQRL
jgi:hypothetical protein